MKFIAALLASFSTGIFLGTDQFAEALLAAAIGIHLFEHAMEEWK